MRRSWFAVLWANAAAFNARAGRRARGLPPLLVFTDPVRLPDPFAVRARLPRGACVVYRHFGAADREAAGRRLAAHCRRQGVKFLVGADPDLARRLRADGVHLPDRPVRLPARRWLVTAARHGAGPRHGPNPAAYVLSPLFASASPSAGAPLGLIGARRALRRLDRPTYGLGGVTGRTARRARGLRLCGLAAIDGIRT